MSDAKDRLRERLQTLKDEYESGQKQLQALETKKQQIEEIMGRIHGAIQVLEEELQEEAAGSG